MRLQLLTCVSAAALLMSTAIADARSLSSTSPWVLKKIDAQVPYCTISKTYNGTVDFTIARNAKGEGTVAFDFNRDAFDLTRAYPVQLRVSGVQRQYSVRPVNQETLILRIGQDISLLDAMEDADKLDVTIDSETFSLGLGQYKSRSAEWSQCLNKPHQMQSAQRTPESNRAIIAQNNRTDTKIQELLDENRRLTTVLSAQTVSPDGKDLKEENKILMARVEELEAELKLSRETINPDMASILAEKDKQIGILVAQNKSLQSALKVAKASISNDGQTGLVSDDEMAQKLFEAQSSVLAFKAERDEYRRLLHQERRRGEGQDIQKARAITDSKLIDDIRRLEQEKAELSRQLDLAQSQEKQMQQKVASAKIEELNTDAIQNSNAKIRTLVSEIAALDAENKMLRNDMVQARSDAKKAVKIEKPVDLKPQMTAKANTSPMPALSGNTIKTLLSDSKIPLSMPVGRVEQVSNGDFAAFQWDTGFVYGSGEQTRLVNGKAFSDAVHHYIKRTQDRCSGSFDKTLESVTASNTITVQSADIACVDKSANGHAASILFFSHQGMFYAMAHEADMNSFKIAMDMRDRLAESITDAF